MESLMLGGILGRGDYFLLFLFRVGAFMMSVPIFGLSLRRSAAKAAFALLFSMILFPVCSDPAWRGTEDLATFVVMIAKETLVGAFLAFVVSIAFSAVRVAGDLIGMEMGLSLASQIDPVTGSSTPLIAYLYEVIAVLLFLSLNFHHWLLQALSSSFEIVPVGSLDFAALTPEFLIGFFSQMLKAGLVLAAPVFVVMGMVSLMMGLLARAVPNFNILDVGYTLRIAVAFGAMFFFMPGFLGSVGRLFETMRESMFSALRAIA